MAGNTEHDVEPVEEYVVICHQEKEVEMELEDDQSLLLSALKSQWSTATGLFYTPNENADGKRSRGVKMTGEKFLPPKRGWGNRIYHVVTSDGDTAVTGGSIPSLKWNASQTEKVCSPNKEVPTVVSKSKQCSLVFQGGQLSLGPPVQTLHSEDAMHEEVHVKMNAEQLRKESAFYGNGNVESHPLTPYEKAINESSYKLVLDDASLLNNRGKLLEAARKKVHNDGYQYKKKATRSKLFGVQATSSTSSSAPKRPRYSSDLRAKRIIEVKEDLEDLTTRIQYTEKSREKFANVQQYDAASSMCKEVSSLKTERRKLQDELFLLEKMDVKSQLYHKVKGNKKHATSSSKSNSTKSSIKAFLQTKETCEVQVLDSEIESNMPQKAATGEDQELPPASFVFNGDEQSHFFCLDINSNQTNS